MSGLGMRLEENMFWVFRMHHWVLENCRKDLPLRVGLVCRAPCFYETSNLDSVLNERCGLSYWTIGKTWSYSQSKVLSDSHGGKSWSGLGMRRGQTAVTEGSSFQAHASEDSILENIVYQASLFLPLKGVGNGPSLIPRPSPSFPSLAAVLF